MAVLAVLMGLCLGGLPADFFADGRTAAPTFQELMNPALFPDPQCGMRVESASADTSGARVQTTGAQFQIDAAAGLITLTQRIGHERDLAALRFDTPLEGLALSHNTPGCALLTIQRPALTLRVNGDSLLMLHAHEPVRVRVEPRLEPGWHASLRNNHVVADEWGAFGLYCSEPTLDDQFEPFEATVAQYGLPADAVLWASVCPPKPYDWERSFRDNVVWHWSNTLGYPADDTLRAWRDHGNIVLLQSEVMLWKDWNFDFVPRLGPEEFARVRETLHGLGMRFIVYTSPYYFLRGTALEPKGFNSFDNFSNWPPGTPTGENMGLFLPAITRVMKEDRPDGLYFDGQYTDNPAALYALARAAREVVGENGILEWHSTHALGPNLCSLPQADAYVDFILRGEGQDQNYADQDYLRYFVAGYNIHNSIGVVCNNGSASLSQELVEAVLRYNGRFHTIAGWLAEPNFSSLLAQYHARLTPDLHAAVDREMDQRQAAITAKAAATREELRRLAAPPVWGAPAYATDFADALPGEPVVSQANDSAYLSPRDGALAIHARAHTHAFLRVPFTGRASGFVVQLRQGTDGGMSWGPAAALRLADGRLVRIGTRSDGLFQLDMFGEQRCFERFTDPNAWVWLRVRWGVQAGVIEYSLDGTTYTRLWRFVHKGALAGEFAELLIGKVPYNGRPGDNTDPGAAGDCAVAGVSVYRDSEAQ